MLAWVGLAACVSDAPPEVARPDPTEIAHPFSIPAEGDVEIGGMQLGRGNRPLIILHGGPGLDHRYLRPALDTLADGHWVIYMDQRGSGLSDTELTPERINFDALLQDIERVRVWTGVEKVDILGHSWGTALAMHYALRYPESVNRMVLVSPVEPGSRYGQQAADRRAARLDPRDAEIIAELTESEEFRRGELAEVSRYYELIFKPLLYNADVPLAIPMGARTARNGFGVMAALAGSMPDPDYWGALPSIEAPTLIVQGEADAYPGEMAIEMASMLANGRAVILEEAGHFPYIEASAGFFTAVRAFLKASEGS